jgi:hypothetical protein
MIGLAKRCRAGSSMNIWAKLAALVAKPRVNLTRFHGVFAPNSKHRDEVTPAKRGKGRFRQLVLDFRVLARLLSEWLGVKDRSLARISRL